MTRPYLLALLLACVYSKSVDADFVLHWTRMATGLSRPVFGTAAPGSPNSLFVVNARGAGAASTGNIQIMNTTTGAINPTPFLSIPGLATGSEQGLLGLAFHPQYQTNGRFFVNYTNSTGTTIVQEYTRSASNPAIADPSSGRQILSIPQPFANHNGGWIGFGPDNQLYIASGDGGSGNDPGGRGQTITNSLLGKMLRINVDGDDFPTDPNRNYSIPSSNPFVGRTGDDEIWSYGLRNPWRPSFDRLTGDLYIADVGQGAREEINVQPANSRGGENYGWGPREGTIATPGYTAGVPLLGTALNPVHEYRRTDGASITGGYVYRGPIAELQGQYFFADFVSNNVWSFQWDGSDPSGFNGTNIFGLTRWRLAPNVGAISGIASFGEDALGNLYLFDLGGSGNDVYKLTSVSIPEPSSLWLLLVLGFTVSARRKRDSLSF
jgi:glucose/arabinose dehydrogenase